MAAAFWAATYIPTAPANKMNVRRFSSMNDGKRVKPSINANAASVNVSNIGNTPSPTVRCNCAQFPSRVDNLPAVDWLNSSVNPKNRPPSDVNVENACSKLANDILPSEPNFFTSPADTPNCSANNWMTGTPASVNWLISSANNVPCTRALP